MTARYRYCLFEINFRAKGMCGFSSQCLANNLAISTLGAFSSIAIDWPTASERTPRD
jgi:hypothetical protein